jgi:23S rRNA (pseudouridine1915-N3)-methyltransferase
MRIRLWAYGRIGRGAEAELVDRYLKRIMWEVTVTELKEGAPFPWPDRANARIILFDERGLSQGSSGFAGLLGDWRDEGVRDVHLALGPADGWSDADRQRADMLLAFGPMTWPHLLARAMLAEQLYRAVSILARHPYHREG